MSGRPGHPLLKVSWRLLTNSLDIYHYLTTKRGLPSSALTLAAEKKLEGWVQLLSSALPTELALLKKKHFQLKILPAIRTVLPKHAADLEPSAWDSGEIVRAALASAPVASNPVTLKYAHSHVTHIATLVQSLGLNRAPSQRELELITKK